MKNIIKFLKGSEGYVVLIVMLLIVQAYCDLALPNYTSDILNVGLQQNGIEYAAPETIRSESLEDLKLFMTDADAELLDAAYEAADADGIRTLKDSADAEEISGLMQLPESVLFQIQTGAAMGTADTEAVQPDEAVQAAEAAQPGMPSMTDGGKFSLDDIKMALATGLMTKEQFLAGIDEKLEAYGDLTDTYLNQIAVGYVAAEYEAQGIELTKVQNHYLLIVGLKMVLMAFLMSVTAILTGLLAARTSAKIGKTLRERLYEKVMCFTNAEMEHFSTASLITRCTNDIQQVQMVVVLLLRIVCYAPILAVCGIIRVVQTGSGMSWIIVLSVIVLMALVGVLVAVAMPKFRIMQSLIDRVNLVSREILTGIIPIRAFSRERYEEKRFEKANDDLYTTQLFTNRTMAFMTPIMMFVMNGISVLIVWVGAGKVDQGTIRVGDLTAFITYSMVIVISFLMLSMISIVAPRAGVAADRILEVLNEPISLKDPEDPQDEKIKDCKGVIEFAQVGFAYPGAEAEALSDISFTAQPGQVTAIIGSTGCGKSTLLNLIPRFFDVTRGQVLLDGTDIRDLTQKALRDKIGYVPQKGMLFSGTIETNLRYGGDTITEDTMKEAARIAQATEFIDEMPDGYDSEIAQEGSNVSGGQRQRLSIARAIAKDPKIYLFDDSFSALDYKTDLKLRTELLKHTGNSTVIIVAQRISMILHADKILCMDEGRIVGQGSHEELMKSCGTYQEIAKSQLSLEELAEIGGVC